MSLKTIPWKGFWSSDDPTNRDKDSAGVGSLFGVGGSFTIPSIITTGGGKPDVFRRYNGTTTLNGVAGSVTSMNFGSGGVDTAFGGTFFIKVNAYNAAGGFVLCKRNGTTPGLNEWQVTVTSTGTVRFILFSNGSGTIFKDITSNTALSIGTWYMISFDYNGIVGAPVLRLFQNGVTFTSTQGGAGSYLGMGAFSEFLYVGAAHNGSSFSNFQNADLDMIGIRTGIWQPSELTRMWNNGNGINPFTDNGGSILYYGYNY